jgi:hypothetical protein
MSRTIKLILIAPLAILGFALFIVLGGVLVKALWNWLLPPLFGWPEVTFWRALGILLLCRILFGGFRLGAATSSGTAAACPIGWPIVWRARGAAHGRHDPEGASDSVGGCANGATSTRRAPGMEGNRPEPSARARRCGVAPRGARAAS